MPEYGGKPNPDIGNIGVTIFQMLKEANKPQTREMIERKTQLSEKTVRTYLAKLLENVMIKEMPNIGRTKLYAPIDYVPVMDESKPLAQRWQVYSQAGNNRFSIGELASYYGAGMPASSVQAAELLLKAPALLVYYAQENELSDDDKDKQLELLKETLKDACEQLQSAIGVFNQLITDPRYWRHDLLQMMTISPDYVLPRDINSIVIRLKEEQNESGDDTDGNS